MKMYGVEVSYKNDKEISIAQDQLNDGWVEIILNKDQVPILVQWLNLIVTKNNENKN